MKTSRVSSFRTVAEMSATIAGCLENRFLKVARRDGIDLPSYVYVQT